METMQGLQGTKIALLIDFDNVILGVEDPGFDVELVVNVLRSRGVVVMGRAYGDWYRHHRHRRKLMEQGIELVETPVFGPLIKNSADIRIVIDGLDIAAAHTHIDTFCLVSGDSDFLPLIKRLQLLGKNVIVIAGNKFTSDLVRRNCNEYLAYENLLAESVGATEDASTLEGSFHLLERAINTLNERGMDSRSSTVKQMMLQLNPAFSERTFGCYQFKQFLDKAARAGIAQVAERAGNAGEHDVLLPEKNSRDASKTSVSSTGNGANETTGRDLNGSAASGSNTNGSNGNAQSGRGEKRESEKRESSRGGRDRNRAQSANDKAETPRIDAKEVVPSVKEAESSTALETPNAAPIAPISASALSSRPGLRRGRLRFSAKAGGTSVAREVPAAEESAQESLSIVPESESSTQLTDAAPVEEAIDVVQTPQDVLPEESVLEAAVADSAEGGDNEATPAKRRGSRGGRRRRGAKNGEIAENSIGENGEVVTETSAAPLETGETVTPEAVALQTTAPEIVEPLAAEATEAPQAADSNPEAPEVAAPKKRAPRRRGGAKKTAAKSTTETPETADINLSSGSDNDSGDSNASESPNQ